MTAETSLTGSAPSIDWAVIRRQLWGVFRLELRRNLLGRRAFGLYFMAFSPVFLWAAGAIYAVVSGDFNHPDGVSKVFVVGFQFFLRISVFLGTLFMFMSAFRAEILERSLHYYFVSPMRREVLVVGKYITSLLATGGTFFVATALLYFFSSLTLGFDACRQAFTQGVAFDHMVAYVGTALIACAGYGALFLLAGLVFKNPVVPAIVIWGWEALNPVLPAFFKYFSVIFYLRSFYPIPLSDEGFFAILAEPPSFWDSVLGIVLFIIFVLVLACWRARRMEIDYGGSD